MSTRAFIGLLLGNHNIKAVYLHFDGYPSAAGKTLKSRFSSRHDATALVSGGSMSSISMTAPPVYYKDRGDDWANVRPTIYENMREFIIGAEENGAEFAYVHNLYDNEWAIRYHKGYEWHAYTNAYNTTRGAIMLNSSGWEEISIDTGSPLYKG